MKRTALKTHIEARCPHCDAPFIKASTGRIRKYCSRACYYAARRHPERFIKPCPVCGTEFDPTPRLKSTCGNRSCVNEMKSRGKRGDRNPMKRADVVQRSHQPVRQRRAAMEVNIAPATKVCMRPDCDGEIKGAAIMYCSPGCHYADRARRGMRREQAYHRCFVCANVFAFSGNGQGKCCSLKCSSSLGSAPAVVEVIMVVKLRGYQRSDFRDDAAESCRAAGCSARVAHQHHVVYSQHVVREHGDRWHPGNALGLCVKHHGETHGLRRIPLSDLRDENFAFAVELLGEGRAYEYLRRRYTGDDARLDALIAGELMAA